MDDADKATREEPLKWFEWLFVENGLNSYRDNFFTLLDGYDTISSNGDEILYYHNAYDENTGNTIYDAIHKRNFSKELKQDLNIQYRQTLRLIDEAIASIAIQDKDPTRFLNLQRNTLYNIQIKSKRYTEKYPFITAILDSIFSYVEEVAPRTVQVPKESDKSFEYVGNTSYLIKMKKYLVEKQIIDNADDFVNIFTGKPFDKKINWKTYANWYHYFVDQLSNVPMLRFNKEEKWIVTSQIFTLKGKDIDHKEIKGNSKKPTGKSKVILDDAIKIINQ